jgi:hypothetical protein
VNPRYPLLLHQTTSVRRPQYSYEDVLFGYVAV